MMDSYEFRPAGGVFLCMPRSRLSGDLGQSDLQVFEPAPHVIALGPEIQ